MRRRRLADLTGKDVADFAARSSASVQACPHQAQASPLPMGSSIGSVSSAKAGKLEMIMMPAAAKAVRANVMESPSVAPLP
jgi:hypothetical protein